MTYQKATTAMARHASVACWGDSLTWGTLSDDTNTANPSYPATLSQALGVPVYNGGVGGQATAHIATRQGGLQPLVTLTGGKIPAASTSPILLTAISPSDGWHNWTGPGRIFNIPGTLAGVAGTLRQDATSANNVFYFVPNAAPQADVTVSAGTPFINTEGDRLRDRIAVIWFGPNCDRTNTAAMIRDVNSMAAHLTSADKRFYLLSISATDANGVAANAALKAAFPEQFIDVTGYLVSNGLADAGITPTGDDTADIAAGYVPRSFRLPVGGSHLTQTAYDLVGNFVARVIAGDFTTAIQLGHPSDTTLSRSAAGVLAVEGVPVVTTIPTRTVTATTTGTTTLTVSSTQFQEFTGSTYQLLYMPTTGIKAGQSYTVINSSSNVIYVYASGGVGFFTIPATTIATFVSLKDTPTVAADWVTYCATTLSTASALVQRDVFGNARADNFIASKTSTATAGGTTTLTIDSAQVQVFTGTTTQTVKLPTTNVVAGQQYTVVNQSTGNVTVQSSGANTIGTLTGASSPTAKLYVALQDTPTAGTHWREI